MTWWTVRGLLLMAMHREGVARLTGANHVTAEAFAMVCPDSKQWFQQLRGTASDMPLSKFFQDVGYDGRPEMFSMYACVLGHASLQVSMGWLVKQEADLKDICCCFRRSNRFDCTPAFAVMELLKHSTRQHRSGS